MNKPELSRFLIIGGTGTLGRGLVRGIYEQNAKAEITILSRDEHKQAAMRREFPKAKFVIGDIRDTESIFRHFLNKDVVFHVAALKHVDVIEENVLEGIKTNIIGTVNAADAAEAAEVKHFVFSSTDKAIDPINAYGMTKGLAERHLFALNRQGSPTKFSVYRWGNVLGSNGSVIPFFAKTLKEDGVAYITDAQMTRFWLPIEWAVRYMLRTFPVANRERAMICPNMKAADVVQIVQAVASVLDIQKYEFKFIGMRPGEKKHESMESFHDGTNMVSDIYDRYTHQELVDMICPIVRPA